MSSLNRPPQRIYLAEHPNGALKIGISWCPKERVRVLGARYGKVKVIWQSEPLVWPIAADFVEATAHNILAKRCIAGEWFKISQGKAIAAITKAIAMVENGDKSLVKRRSYRSVGVVEAALVTAGILMPPTTAPDHILMQRKHELGQAQAERNRARKKQP